MTNNQSYHDHQHEQMLTFYTQSLQDVNNQINSLLSNQRYIINDIRDLLRENNRRRVNRSNHINENIFQKYNYAK